MPTYYAAGVNIRLATTSAGASLTPTSSRSITGNDREETVRIDSAMSAAHILGERLMSLSLSSDDVTDDQLHFLGNNPHVPFYCVGVRSPLSNATLLPSTDAMEIDHDETQASTGVEIQSRGVNVSTSSLSSLGSTPFSSPQPAGPIDIQSSVAPKKIILRTHKQSSPAQQISLLDTRLMQPKSPIPVVVVVNLNRLLSHSRSLDQLQKPKDIKITVFFNGQLTHCSHLSERHKNTEGKTTCYFSGMRVDRVAEAAWLIFAPSDETKRKKKSDVQDKLPVESLATQRWDQIATAIGAEASFLGLDESRSRPPLGEYLHNLSRLRMPPSVADLITGKGRTYGVIDVVLTLGNGQKYPVSHGFLKRAEHLKDPRFEPEFLSQDTAQPKYGVNGINLEMPPLSQSLQTLASTRSKRGSSVSQRASSSAVDELTSGVKAQLNISPPPACLPGSAQTTTSAQIPKQDTHKVSWPKKRKIMKGAKATSAPGGYSPIQRLARRPSQETDHTKLGLPRIFFPERDPDYFKGEGQNKQLSRSTTTTTDATTGHYEKSKKSLILTFKVSKTAKSRGNHAGNNRKVAGGDGSAKETVTKPKSKISAPKEQQRVNLEQDREPPLKKSKSILSLASYLDGPAWNPPSKTSSPPTQLNDTPTPAKPNIVKLSPYSTNSLYQSQSSIPTKRHLDTDSDTNRATAFAVPPLSQNCILSYLPPSSTDTSNKKKRAKAAGETGAVRHCRSERTGEFIEEQVLLGCRYVVGG